MGKCKLATLQRLFESPSLPHMPPTAPPPHCLMLQGGGCVGILGGGDIFMYSFRSALCTLLKEGLYVYLCRSVAQREENTVISTNALS